MELGSTLEKKIIQWLDNIIGVPAKELGLFTGDLVRRWRVKNQLNTLEKSIEKCKQLKLPLKVISPKLLCPLLENCSLEDNEFMQDKWANLLVNMLDSEQNIQNHVFPYLLSQISKNEYQGLHSYVFERPRELEDVVEQLDVVEKQLEGNNFDKVDFELTVNENAELKLLIDRKAALQQRADGLLFFQPQEFKVFEYDNLLRLGLIHGLPISQTTSDLFGDEPSRPISIMHTGFHSETSQLGDLFMLACERNSK